MLRIASGSAGLVVQPRDDLGEVAGRRLASTRVKLPALVGEHGLLAALVHPVEQHTLSVRHGFREDLGDAPSQHRRVGAERLVAGVQRLVAVLPTAQDRDGDRSRRDHPLQEASAALALGADALQVAGRRFGAGGRRALALVQVRQPAAEVPGDGTGQRHRQPEDHDAQGRLAAHHVERGDGRLRHDDAPAEPRDRRIRDDRLPAVRLGGDQAADVAAQRPVDGRAAPQRRQVRVRPGVRRREQRPFGSPPG